MYLSDAVYDDTALTKTKLRGLGGESDSMIYTSLDKE